jgi:O-antigen ligase
VLEDGVRPDMQLGYWHHAHNDHLELMVEFGVFGYALLSMLLLCHVVLAWQALSSRSTLHRSVGALVIMVITAASIHALVEFVFHTPALRAVYVALLGLVAGLPQQRRAIDSKRVLVAETNDGGRE